MTKNIMLDLETMGNGNNAAIVAIGAVEFDPHATGFSFDCCQSFYEKVNLESSVKAGMQIDTSTILWWMKQSDEARKSTFEGIKITLVDALLRFNAWVYHLAPEKGQTEPDRADVAVWGNGAMFDNVIIRSAFKAIGSTPCWSFRNDKCYRTVINLLPENRRPPFERSGTAHNALDDAITQAKYLQRVYHELGV